ncbi:MAG: hypothetical protein LBD47_08575, partial [Treponema sp.]|nr:hypothetical protein [Treponema sp.]
AAGTAQVTGTIPAARAGTTDKTVSVTVNVSAPPVTSKTLRFIRAAGIDTLEAIVLVNTNYNGFATVYTPSPSAASNYTAYLKENSSNTTAYTGQNTSNQPLLWQTGQTGVPWMNADNKTLYTNNDKFRKAFMLGLDVTYLDIKLKHGNNSYNIDTRLGTASEIYGDYEVVLGPEGENKYFIFFMEGDKNRGTSDGSFNPTKVEENFYFFVDLDKLPEVTRNGEKVVPIFYDSGTNVASIGINFTKSPAANRKYPPLKHNNYKTAYSFDAE